MAFSLSSKIIILIGLSISFNVHALKKEITIKTRSSSLPLTKVTIDNNKITWSAFKMDGPDSVLLYSLNKSHAERLLDISRKAKNSYSEIINQGRCPKYVVKSGEIGRISYGNEIIFEVVCSNNNIMVQITMIDEYAINIVTNKVEWRDIEKLALDVLQIYKNN